MNHNFPGLGFRACRKPAMEFAAAVSENMGRLARLPGAFRLGAALHVHTLRGELGIFRETNRGRVAMVAKELEAGFLVSFHGFHYPAPQGGHTVIFSPEGPQLTA